jgi:hypothetical protein
VRTRRTTLLRVPPVQVKEAGACIWTTAQLVRSRRHAADFEQLEAERLDLGERSMQLPPGLRMRLPGACIRLALPLAGLGRLRRWRAVLASL